MKGGVYRMLTVQIPDEIKGVKLNKEQKEALREGKGVFLENMISNRKIPFPQLFRSMPTRKVWNLSILMPNSHRSSNRNRRSRTALSPVTV